MKSQQTSLLLLLFLCILPLSSAVLGGGGRGPIAGGWTPIKDPKEQHVKEIGEFAVNEHNKEANTKLVFEGVIRGESQVVSGMNYKLIVSAEDGKSTNSYEAVVWEKSWQNFKNLTSFKKS